MFPSPIGVFDSGLGGLTGFRALKRLLPDYPLVYFGDTARVPYGTKTESTIRRYARQDIRFLLSHSVSAILVACGTVSSVALPALKGAYPLPIIGVVEPAAEAACRMASGGSGKVLVLGTEATVRSCAFEKAIRSRDSRLTVRQQACPLFVPLAENLHTKRGDPAATAVAHAYLDPYLDFRPDVILLGCTHFPLLSEIIRDVFPGPFLVSAGEEAAAETAKTVLGPESPGTRRSADPAGDLFFTSGNPTQFALDASAYLDRPVSGVTRIAISRF